MGGGDLRHWTTELVDARLLAPRAAVVAYSYIGPQLTWAIYRDGTVGEAKKDLEATVRDLDRLLSQQIEGRSVISVNKAVVTQASAAIAAVPLYISLLYKVMKEAGSHEGPIEQMIRLFSGSFGRTTAFVDPEGRVRLDDRELEASIQQASEDLWPSITSDNLRALADFDGYRSEFRRLFGFEVPRLDYDEPIETAVDIPGVVTVATT
jgi:enoyl-[acyl-carrier protein] reductase / trans-2-enoyl-CoA reductase (NAD+)